MKSIRPGFVRGRRAAGTLVVLAGLASACAGASPEGDTLGDEGELIVFGSEPDPVPEEDAGVDAGAPPAPEAPQ